MSIQFYCNTCENEDSFTLNPRSGLPVCSECSSADVEIIDIEEEYYHERWDEDLAEERKHDNLDDNDYQDLEDMFR